MIASVPTTKTMLNELQRDHEGPRQGSKGPALNRLRCVSLAHATDHEHGQRQ